MQNLIWTTKAVQTNLRRSWRGAGNRLAVQMARLAPAARAFVSQPEPRSYGSAARGIQLSAGNFLVAGEIIQDPTLSIWDIPCTDGEYCDSLQGFCWLDDLAACDSPDARRKAQEWLFEWIDRHGTRAGPGWRADVTGRRVIRWINHALMLLNQQPPERSRIYFKSLGQQAHYLAKRWRTMRAGLPRFEALTGLVYCGLALEGKGHFLQPALRALGMECRREIARDGSIVSRNPEALMEVFTLLSWVTQAASAEHMQQEPDILKAVERMAPTLRALRLGDGGLVRFHGGGTGRAEQLDQALADAGIRTPARMHGAMGYTRMVSGATRLVMDTAKLPPKAASERAHACTLAFELSSGVYPLFVNQGRSYGFSPKIREATRDTAAHNTLSLGKASSATFEKQSFVSQTFGRRWLRAPRVVTVLTDQNRSGRAVRATHDGYAASHGLVHFRQISMINNGFELHGVDEVKCETAADRARFDKKAKGPQRKAIPFRVQFHIHPDVEAGLDLNGTAVSLRLLNGETWVFRKGEGRGRLKLVPSLFMDPGRLRPRDTKQIVVSSRAMNYEGRVTWTLTRSA